MATARTTSKTTPGPSSTRPTATSAKTSVAGTPPAEEISKRAFQIWEQNGRVPGRDLENWLQAERELRRQN